MPSPDEKLAELAATTTQAILNQFLPYLPEIHLQLAFRVGRLVCSGLDAAAAIGRDSSFPHSSPPGI